MIDFRLLGTLEAVDEGQALPLGGPQQRAVLAMLLLQANKVVPTERMIDSVWGDRPPPPTAATTVQVYVSRLRKQLGRELLLTRGAGYLLQVAPVQIDVARAERLIAAAQETLEPAQRVGLLRDALDLWRGTALADFADQEFARAESERLEELRLTTLESAFDAELELRRHAEVLPELEALVDAQPLRERVRAQLMLALYRAGRHADALEVYRDGRRLLLDELGLEPGPAIRELERRILAHDSRLDAAPVARTAPRPPEERKMLSALVLALIRLDDVGALDPEEERSALEPHVERISRELDRFGGSVEKLVGDALLAVFGAPLAYEDHAERAVRAALAVRDLVAETTAPALGVRIGVGSGEALVRAGVTGDWSSSAFGHLFGDADRLRAAAPASTVLVSDPVQLATRHAISYRRLDADGPWEALAAVAAIRARTRSPSARLVGRANELQLVADSLRAAGDRDGPRLLTILGVPGIGKTRLLREAAALPEAATALWLEGRSIPYGDGVAYWAFAEAVKAHAGIRDTDTQAEASNRLHHMLGPATPRLVENQLRVLVGLQPDEALTERPAAFAAWRRFLEARASEHPVVLALEDVHWADDGLLDFVEYVAAARGGAAIVLLCTARPELLGRRPEWGTSAGHATTIELPPLSDDEIRALVETLADTPLDQELAERVVERVGGNPLFAEEYVRTLVESDLADERLPASVQSVIAARLDRLPPDAKALLQDAAVIGKVFWPGSVAAIGGRSRAGCEAQLEQLRETELVHREERSAMQDDPQYSFRHVLIRDVAYGQIPRAQRSAKHRLAAEWIESHARPDDVAELTAHHYSNALSLARSAGLDAADLVPRTVEALWEAGERARQLYANRDAAQYFGRALDLLGESSADADWATALYVRIRESLGDVLELTGNHADGELAFESALALASGGDLLRCGRLLRKLALSRQLQRRIDEARETLVAADEALGNEPAGAPWWRERCEIAIQRLQLLYFGASLETFAAETRRVRPLVEQHGTAAQRSLLFNWLAMVRMRRDRFVTSDEAMDYGRAALAAALDCDSSAELAYVWFANGFLLLWGRRLDEAERHMREALGLAERAGDATTRLRCLNYLTVVERWRGNVEATRDLAQLTLQEAERTEMLEYVVQARASLAWVAWRDGEHDLAAETARSVAERWVQFPVQHVLAWMPHWPLLGVAVVRGADSEAIEHARVIVDPTRQPAPPDLDAVLTDAVTAWDGGDHERARRSLATAREIAARYGYL